MYTESAVSRLIASVIIKKNPLNQAFFPLAMSRALQYFEGYIGM